MGFAGLHHATGCARPSPNINLTSSSSAMTSPTDFVLANSGRATRVSVCHRCRALSSSTRPMTDTGERHGPEPGGKTERSCGSNVAAEQGGACGVRPTRSVNGTARMGRGRCEIQAGDRRLGSRQAGNGPKDQLLLELAGATADVSTHEARVLAFEIVGTLHLPSDDRVAEAWCVFVDAIFHPVDELCQGVARQASGSSDVSGGVTNDVSGHVGVRPQRSRRRWPSAR